MKKLLFPLMAAFAITFPFNGGFRHYGEYGHLCFRAGPN
ncbi:hypothetical protein LTSEMON_6332 [Salmonella enterica subsp. enterica serovar Montevideo str. S5-403]|uniref:Uncharacterized protein n=1 Tax=Salmonella enterica subsp. enterica serovar Montevideo str. S5-403 TaxID=913242 RepID=G5PX63_SALMO|nr:hypothetical protein LTSEMON_6332 [Salmonella enterica subsp. enterica serovar Montevideo str. S5-403]